MNVGRIFLHSTLEPDIIEFVNFWPCRLSVLQ